MSHQKYMNIALNLAKRGLGKAWPNPSVGCVIVKDGIVISRATTAEGGRPHAESAALKNIDAEGATAYVTLEPCAHEGATLSCAGLLVTFGVKTVVVATKDPDPRTAGKGIEMMREAGLEVIEGICEKEAIDINKGFFSRISKDRPYIALKAATTDNNMYFKGDGSPKWVTNELSRNYVNMLRSKFDAIVTGTGTVLADNPSLNVRLNGMKQQSPLKFVIGKTKIPEDYNIYSGRELVTIDRDLQTSGNIMAQMGVTRALIEAGPKLSNALLKEGLVDEVLWFKSSDSSTEGEQFFEDGVLDNFSEYDSRKFDNDKLLKLRKSS